MKVKTTKSELESRIYRFLVSVQRGNPFAVHPVFTDHAALTELSSDPNPGIQEAIRRIVEQLLINIFPPQHKNERSIKVSSSIMPLTLTIYNCMAHQRQISEIDSDHDPIVTLTQELSETILPAETLDEALVFHAILKHAIPVLTQLSPEYASILHKLIDLSPLTALCSPDVHTPSALNRIAAELLPGWKKNGQPDLYPSWLTSVDNLLSDKAIARWIRRKWLKIPETRTSCRNIGLILEFLRQKDKPKYRPFILEFYESYDYFLGKQGKTGKRSWDILPTIETLLKIQGDCEGAIMMNRRGNEYFLKFRPLIKIIEEEKVMPADFRFLTKEFVFENLRPLLDYVTETSSQKVVFSNIEFGN